MSTPAVSFDGPRAFCRDCLGDLDIKARRCGECGSPRLVRHHALPSLTLAHIDCDAFYATVEKRDNPELADRPVIIGGGKRGVVSAACYVSRTYGVRSAMPMFKALALCPQAAVIPPDMAKYVRVGREVRHAMQTLTPLVEPLSIDEAFLDLAGTQRVHGMIPAKVLARFARDVERDIGITVSVGLSCNKFLAKIASDLDKPRGFAALDQDEARAMLAEKPVASSSAWDLRARNGCCSAGFVPSPTCNAPAANRGKRGPAGAWGSPGGGSRPHAPPEGIPGTGPFDSKIDRRTIPDRPAAPRLPQ